MNHFDTFLTEENLNDKTISYNSMLNVRKIVQLIYKL